MKKVYYVLTFVELFSKRNQSFTTRLQHRPKLMFFDTLCNFLKEIYSQSWISGNLLQTKEIGFDFATFLNKFKNRKFNLGGTIINAVKFKTTL